MKKNKWFNQFRKWAVFLKIEWWSASSGGASGLRARGAGGRKEYVARGRTSDSSDDRIIKKIRISWKAARWFQWDLGCELLVCSSLKFQIAVAFPEPQTRACPIMHVSRKIGHPNCTTCARSSLNSGGSTTCPLPQVLFKRFGGVAVGSPAIDIKSVTSETLEKGKASERPTRLQLVGLLAWYLTWWPQFAPMWIEPGLHWGSTYHETDKRLGPGLREVCNKLIV